MIGEYSYSSLYATVKQAFIAASSAAAPSLGYPNRLISFRPVLRTIPPAIPYHHGLRTGAVSCNSPACTPTMLVASQRTRRLVSSAKTWKRRKLFLPCGPKRKCPFEVGVLFRVSLRTFWLLALFVTNLPAKLGEKTELANFFWRKSKKVWRTTQTDEEKSVCEWIAMFKNGYVRP